MKPTGLYTALVTPMNSAGDLDLKAFVTLINAQIDAGVNGLVVCGSTGEGATLTSDEKQTLWSTAVQHVAGRVPVVAGTGSNDTRATVELSRLAKNCGVDALLLVSPYYNKPPQAGLIAHHREISQSVDIPQILYNVPGRTSSNMLPETQLAIAELCPNVVATKEASANLEQMSEIIRHAPAHFSLLAGDDSLTLPIIACGGKGVIAVISHYLPRTFGALVRSALNGDIETARRHHNACMPYYSANFLESNPIPIKYIMHKLGHMELAYRLPLLPPSLQVQQRLDDVVASVNDTV
jgi:4-hydroxy-tetrahydrodipicolinate synthase